MNKAARCQKIYDSLYEIYGDVKCPLEYKSPFQLLVAAVLSAQCTDARVNSVLPGLFKEFPDAPSFASADASRIEEMIKPCGLYRVKAGNIIRAAKIITYLFKGELPSTIEELSELPGVGRKTANVIISHVFNGPGFAVDTHVIRLLNRIGIVDTENPLKIEAWIRELVQPVLLGNFSLLLIMHGRRCCKARKPDCHKCVIEDMCLKKINVKQEG